MKMENTELFTPPKHINFLAEKLFGNADVTDISMAYIEKNGGGPTENHTHPHDHLFIVTEGEAKIILGDETVIIGKNQHYLVKGNIPHSVWNNTDGQTVMIGINILN